MRALLRRLRGEEGFGLLELLIAITILAIATSSLVGVFVAGHLALRRASQADSATVLADKLLERFRAEQFDDIALSNNLLSGVDSTYANDPNDPFGSVLGTQLPNFGNITDSNWSDSANAGASATSCAVSADGPTVPVTCVPSRVIPDSSRGESSPDGRSYRIDTYVTWACSNPATQTLSGSTGAPTCTDGSGTVALGAVKVVTVIVRDDSSPAALASAPLYRSSTTFDRLGGSVTCSGLPCGGGIPTATVTPTGTQSTSTTQTTTAGSAPNSPTSIVLANGGGTGSTYIDQGNVGTLNVDVSLPSTSVASDTITLKLTDGSTTIQQTLSGTQGAGIVHFTNINAQALADGTITITATASNNSGSSSPTGIQPTKDTSTPAAPTSISFTNGQGQSNNYVNIANKASVATSVTLGATSQSADTVSVKISDGSNSTNPVTANGIGGGGSEAMPAINASSLTDGTVTASATVTSAAGNTSPATTVSFGKDTLAPTATITRAGANPTSAASVSWTATFNDTVFNVAAGNFALVKGGGLGGTPTISSVTGSGTTWTVTSSTGSGSGTLGLNLTTAGSLVDKANNPITALPITGAVYTIDSAPTVTSVQLVNGGSTAGKVEKGDQIVVTFSKAMDTTSFCSGWDGTTISGNGQVVVTVTDGTGGTNDTVTVTTTSGCTFNFGTVNLGSNAYVSGGNLTFSGNGSNKSTIAWNSGTNTLTITLGGSGGSGTAATVSSSNAVYTPNAAITDSLGTAITGTGSTGNVKNF